MTFFFLQIWKFAVALGFIHGTGLLYFLSSIQSWLEKTVKTFLSRLKIFPERPDLT